jgi:hypothetical protein
VRAGHPCRRPPWGPADGGRPEAEAHTVAAPDGLACLAQGARDRRGEAGRGGAHRARGRSAQAVRVTAAPPAPVAGHGLGRAPVRQGEQRRVHA